jgi:hypothetical protein
MGECGGETVTQLCNHTTQLLSYVIILLIFSERWVFQCISFLGYAQLGRKFYPLWANVSVWLWWQFSWSSCSQQWMKSFSNV